MKHEFGIKIELARHVSPLSWWRDWPALAYTPEFAHQLWRELWRVKMPADPKWRAALRGDAAIAIGFAIRVVRDKSASPDQIDAAMSLVLSWALRGDSAAREVLIFALRRQKRPACDLIAESWCAAPIEKPAKLPTECRRKPRFARPPKWLRLNGVRASRHC